MADRQIQLSGALLEEAYKCLNEHTTGGVLSEAAVRELNTRSNRVLASFATLLRGAASPGSFSGGETGQYKLDPTQSPFL